MPIDEYNPPDDFFPFGEDPDPFHPTSSTTPSPSSSSASGPSTGDSGESSSEQPDALTGDELWYALNDGWVD